MEDYCKNYCDNIANGKNAVSCFVIMNIIFIKIDYFYIQYGNTALDEARSKGHDIVVTYLESEMKSKLTDKVMIIIDCAIIYFSILIN